MKTDPIKKTLKVPKSGRNTPSPRSYPLRSRSGSLLSSSPVKSPLKNSPKAPNIPSTLSEKCSICMSSDTLRNLNLKSAVSDFNSKIEDYNLVSKSLLMDMYRCYSNIRDKIHLGHLGIKHLSSILVNAISRIDRRSFATILQSGQT